MYKRQIENRYGEREPKQEKALEALGIPLPDPAKKPSRTNNRKVTFDRLCRDLLLAICREHGLEVETEAIYGGRASREKNDYIIEAQREKIAELEKRNAQLTEENTNQARRLAQKTAEMDPVSYTHLDVYKRQGRWLPSIKTGLSCIRLPYGQIPEPAKNARR